MHWKRILGRLTGISFPVFGVSWNPPEPEIEVARRVITFLEDRRVLFVPYQWEVPDYCVESVLEVRRFLTDQLSNLHGKDGIAENLRAMRAACREFLNPSSPQHMDPAHRPRMRRVVPSTRDIWGHGGPDQWLFWSALGELRSTIGLHLAMIAVKYGLEIEDELATILPPEADENDANDV